MIMTRCEGGHSCCYVLNALQFIQKLLSVSFHVKYVAEWRSGGVAEWRSGGVAEWRSGGVAK